MSPLRLLAPYFDRLDRGSTLRWRGRVLQVVGNLIESEGPFCSIGESCEITSAIGKKYSGEVIGFRGSTMLSMAVENPQGIRFGDRIRFLRVPATVAFASRERLATLPF